MQTCHSMLRQSNSGSGRGALEIKTRGLLLLFSKNQNHISAMRLFPAAANTSRPQTTASKSSSNQLVLQNLSNDRRVRGASHSSARNILLGDDDGLDVGG